jgi:rSAM/selenodomain-associated transferase 1
MQGPSAAVLVLFCRRPRLGQGKQRLARALGTAQALAISQALLACALEDAAAWPGEVLISPESSADASWAHGLLGRAAHVLAQPAGNLGERLNAVDAALRARGRERLIFIGSDSPSLTLADLGAAQAALRESDVALAPAADGGVTVMGARVPWPDLAALPWSEPTLGEALESCCRGRGFSVARLRASYDIDQASDLTTARRALAVDDRPARRALYELLSTVVVNA